MTGSSYLGNNGAHVITAVLDLSNIQTATTGLTTETPAGGFGLTVQPLGTAFQMPEAMTPWELGPKIHAALAIRQGRQQDDGGLTAKLAALKQRIVTAAANRTEEVPQTPLRDRGGFGWGWGGGF